METLCARRRLVLRAEVIAGHAVSASQLDLRASLESPATFAGRAYPCMLRTVVDGREARLAVRQSGSSTPA